MAYVARGQGEAFWMSHVESLTPILQKRAAEFGVLLTAPEARGAFEAATGALENFRTLDAKARESVQSGNALLAADMIFSDGLESMATASTQLAAALNHELQYRSADMASVRSRQLAIAGGAGGAILLLMVGLVLLGGASTKSAEPEAVTAVPAVEPIRFEAPLPKARAAVTPKLLTTAQLCRELSRVVDSASLPHLLERAARVLDASGIIVWVAEPSRQRLVPALSHGYDDKYRHADGQHSPRREQRRGGRLSVVRSSNRRGRRVDERRLHRSADHQRRMRRSVVRGNESGLRKGRERAGARHHFRVAAGDARRDARPPHPSRYRSRSPRRR